MIYIEGQGQAPQLRVCVARVHSQKANSGAATWCWLTMWVLKSLSWLCLMSRLCPQYVQPVSRVCPCPMNDQYLPSISNFCPCQIQYLSLWSNLCPQFGLLGYQNWWKICRTKSSQTLDMTIYAFTIWLPCKWTKLGQSLDSGKSKVCPSFVHELFSI